MESSARLENENTDLLSQMDTLRCSMHQLKEMLVEAHRKCAEERRESEAKTFKELEFKHKTFTHNDELLVETLSETEAKLLKAMKCNTTLEQERAELFYQVHLLRHSLQELEEMLSDSERKYEAIKQEKEQEAQAHNILKRKYKKMLEFFNAV
ncbi:hypothetical protein KOW79_000187 [Hemibagrus wyckioides]|uniref:Uncharacterized protein n=1 Tax=Hemibagrus wyckioides TaxID=337641 RepID=A0A9D3SXT7_9TELE|nr:hypothetical protein KOW79_000187 [Hemibagrus wyckioides]